MSKNAAVMTMPKVNSLIQPATVCWLHGKLKYFYFHFISLNLEELLITVHKCMLPVLQRNIQIFDLKCTRCKEGVKSAYSSHRNWHNRCDKQIYYENECNGFTVFVCSQHIFKWFVALAWWMNGEISHYKFEIVIKWYIYWFTCIINLLSGRKNSGESVSKYKCISNDIHWRTKSDYLKYSRKCSFQINCNVFVNKSCTCCRC